MNNEVNVPEEAVEAVAELLYEQQQTYSQRDWKALDSFRDEAKRKHWRQQARRLLQAAAPALRSQEHQRVEESLRHQRCINALSDAIQAKKSYPAMIEDILAAAREGHRG